MGKLSATIKYIVKSLIKNFASMAAHGSKGAVGVSLFLLTFCIRAPATVLQAVWGALRSGYRYHKNT